MKALFTIIILFLHSSCRCQIPVKFLAETLHQLNYKELHQLLNNLSKPNHFDAYKEISREVIPGYKEEIIMIQQSWDAEKAQLPYDYNYQINLIVKANAIIYYQFGPKKYKETDCELNQYLDTISEFKSTKDFKAFKEQFKNLYHFELADTDLCIKDIQFGYTCGLIGKELKAHKELQNILSAKNHQALFDWLCSPNAEKQVYALEGFDQFIGLGEKLSGREWEVIQLVMQKNEKVRACGGCKLYEKEICELAQYFKNLQRMLSYNNRGQS